MKQCLHEAFKVLSDAGSVSLGLTTAAGTLWWQSCSQGMIFSKPGMLRVKAAEKWAFAELQASPVSCFCKIRAVCCAPDTV